jgi:hypothetical protein
MFTPILNYIYKESNKIKPATSEITKKFIDYGTEHFLTHNAFESFKVEYISSILRGIEIDITQVMGDATKEEVVKYFNKLLTHYQNKMMNGNVIPYSTNPMLNIVALWKHECNAIVIEHIKSLISIANSLI